MFMCVRPHATNLEPKHQKITIARLIYTNLNNLKENSIILSSFAQRIPISHILGAAETKRVSQEHQQMSSPLSNKTIHQQFYSICVLLKIIISCGRRSR
jgi:hypothetical protein